MQNLRTEHCSICPVDPTRASPSSTLNPQTGSLSWRITRTLTFCIVPTLYASSSVSHEACHLWLSESSLGSPSYLTQCKWPWGQVDQRPQAWSKVRPVLGRREGVELLSWLTGLSLLVCRREPNTEGVLVILADAKSMVTSFSLLNSCLPSTSALAFSLHKDSFYLRLFSSLGNKPLYLTVILLKCSWS